MNLKLINHKDYWLLVDTEAIASKGDKVYSSFSDRIFTEWLEHQGIHNDTHWKIIAHLPKHKDAPVLEGVLLLPSLEYGHSNKSYAALARWEKLNKNQYAHLSREELAILHEGFIEGYEFELPKQEEETLLKWAEAKAVSKYSEEKNPLMDYKARIHQRLGYYNGLLDGAATKRYSEEDMRKAIEFGEQLKEAKNSDQSSVGYFQPRYDEKINTFLQSLSPVTLPVGFEPEYEVECEAELKNCECISPKCSCEKTFKTIKNEAGQEVLQGEWIHE